MASISGNGSNASINQNLGLWSSVPAGSNVDMNGFDINNVLTLECSVLSATDILIDGFSADFVSTTFLIASNTLIHSALVVGDDASFFGGVSATQYEGQSLYLNGGINKRVILDTDPLQPGQLNINNPDTAGLGWVNADRYFATGAGSVFNNLQLTGSGILSAGEISTTGAADLVSSNNARVFGQVSANTLFASSTIRGQTVLCSNLVASNSISTIAGGSMTSDNIFASNLTLTNLIGTVGGQFNLGANYPNQNYFQDNGIADPFLNIGFGSIQMNGNPIQGLPAGNLDDEPVIYSQFEPMQQFIKVYYNGNFSIADSSNVIMNWTLPDTQLINDTMSSFTLTGSGTNAGIVLNNTGTYEIHASVCWDVNTTGTRLMLIYVNGNYFDSIRSDAVSNGSNYLIHEKKCVRKISAGGRVQILLYQNSGGALNVISQEQAFSSVGNSTFLYIRRIF